MNEEIEQIEKNKTWTLFPRPKDKNVNGTKQVFRNKLNEDGKVSLNKEILVCKGILKKKVLTMVKPFPLLQYQKVLGLYLHMYLTKDSKYIRWMLNLHS